MPQQAETTDTTPDERPDGPDGVGADDVRVPGPAHRRRPGASTRSQGEQEVRDGGRRSARRREVVERARVRRPQAMAPRLEEVDGARRRAAGRTRRRRNRQAVRRRAPRGHARHRTSRLGREERGQGAASAQGAVRPGQREPGQQRRVRADGCRRRHRPVELPLYTPMGSISYALAAGNTVVFKPSELTPGVAVWLADKWKAARPQSARPAGGHRRRVDRRLPCVSAGVDKIAFTGSAATGKRVMAACAETLTPLVVEARRQGRHARRRRREPGRGRRTSRCSGRWATPDRRAPASNASTSSTRSTTRSSGWSPRSRRSCARRPGRRLRSDDDDQPVRRRPRPRRGRARQGRISGGRRADSIKAGYVEPIVLTDVPEDSTAIREETFGPTVVVNKVARPRRSGRDGQRHHVRARRVDLHQGRDKAMQAGREARVGVVTINSVLGFAGIAGAAVRWCRRFGLRAHPRRGRPARVQPGQVDRPSEVRRTAESADHASANRGT